MLISSKHNQCGVHMDGYIAPVETRSRNLLSYWSDWVVSVFGNNNSHSQINTPTHAITISAFCVYSQVMPAHTHAHILILKVNSALLCVRENAMLDNDFFFFLKKGI